MKKKTVKRKRNPKSSQKAAKLHFPREDTLTGQYVQPLFLLANLRH